MILLVVATGVVAANEQPEAEAGLNQDAIVNATVYLDAGGSWDPDGEIVTYKWRIGRPNGTISYPDCRRCSLTHFVPRQAGQYNVTMVVTDDDGRTPSDTLYVMVSDPRPARVSSGSSGSSGAASGSSSFGDTAGDVSPGTNPSRIIRNDAGEYVLRTRGGSLNRDFTMMVGGQRVTIPAAKMGEVSADDGKVTYVEASRYFNQAGADRDDVRHELQNSRSPGYCGGNTCTSRVTETDGGGDNRQLSDQDAEEAVEEAVGCAGCIKGSNRGVGDGCSNDGSTNTGGGGGSSVSGTDPGDLTIDGGNGNVGDSTGINRDLSNINVSR